MRNGGGCALGGVSGRCVSGRKIDHVRVSMACECTTETLLQCNECNEIGEISQGLSGSSKSVVGVKFGEVRRGGSINL